MARPTHNQIRALGNFQHTYRWDVNIVGPQNGPKLFESINDINFRMESIDLPQKTNQKMQVDIRGHQHQEPGIMEWSKSITMNFVETTPHVVQVFFDTWSEAIWGTNTGISRPKEELYATVYIYMLNVQDQRVGRYKLINCFPEAEDPGGTLDGSTSDALKPNLTLSFDTAKYRRF